MPDRSKIGRVRITADRNTRQTERQLRFELRERGVGQSIARRAVGDDADLVAALDLAVGKIDDMAEQTTDRRTQDVEDLHSGFSALCAGAFFRPRTAATSARAF